MPSWVAVTHLRLFILTAFSCLYCLTHTHTDSVWDLWCQSQKCTLVSQKSRERAKERLCLFSFHLPLVTQQLGRVKPHGGKLPLLNQGCIPDNYQKTKPPICNLNDKTSQPIFSGNTTRHSTCSPPPQHVSSRQFTTSGQEGNSKLQDLKCHYKTNRGHH